MYVYNVENLTLAGAVTLRLFGNPAPAKRRFYIALSIYPSYALVALVLGYMELERNMAQGLQDVLWGLPCLLLLSALLAQPDHVSAGDEANKNSNGSDRAVAGQPESSVVHACHRNHGSQDCSSVCMDRIRLDHHRCGTLWIASRAVAKQVSSLAARLSQ